MHFVLHLFNLLSLSFFVNASVQLCGVAEMIGPFDFHRDMLVAKVKGLGLVFFFVSEKVRMALALQFIV